MKKILLISVAVFAMILSGCQAAKKSPSVTQTGSTQGTSGAASGGNDTFGGAGSLASGLGKIYFDFDKYNIRSDMQAVVNSGANLLKGQAGGAQITVEGNCDEWGTDEYNQALGLRRANAVKKALVTLGLNSKQIAVKSYGETNPVCTERTAECDALNRRAEIKVGL
ncbi:OmpA family protein [Campylobacter sp. MIT 97-5078]|uniref:OmpA family protein n=1 Tax=Campylobacter sp. MIT 97-5078 TaxID=1548153 RepID=UPI000512B61D|nr:OmpA family protein [Campylobacter sp. MIT 97-5078]KGI56513.1 lipoprotein [Campylobacter sp. MIT 97-5078]TQR27035.1 peptidoglycan-associated lipoprotein [Campylobacter sp. MIT 97-5078]